MSEQVKAGTCWRDNTPGYWRWDGTRIMVCDDPRPTEDVSSFDLRRMLEMEANGTVWRVPSEVPTPDPRDAVVAAARKIYTAIKTRQLIDNPLNSTGEDELMLQYFDALDEALSALDRAGGGK